MRQMNADGKTGDCSLFTYLPLFTPAYHLPICLARNRRIFLTKGGWRAKIRGRVRPTVHYGRDIIHGDSGRPTGS